MTIARSPSSASLRAVEPPPSQPSPQRRKTDADSTWHPEEGDDSAEAGLKRANILARDVAELRADRDADRAVLTRVAESVDGLNRTLARLVRLLAWAGAIVGAAVLVAGTSAALGVFGRIRLDPPALQAPAVPR